MRKRYKRILLAVIALTLVAAVLFVPAVGAYAETGDVAGAVEDTWNSAQA